MTILDYVFYPPLPVVYAFLLLLLLSTPKLRSKWWAKVGIAVGALLLILCVIAAIQASTAKRYAGKRIDEIRSIKKVTKTASELIAEGQHKKAKELLDRFNGEYSAGIEPGEAEKILESISKPK